ncbi:MAG: aquaporin [Candidatus Gastranaerophilales bacterium]|nr:aquaporin [Candidatus Gastranaerophilales bacterium]
MNENLKKYVVEIIGTFFLVFTVASAVLMAGDGVIAPISIGFALMIMVYAGGHISGGHYNPAVSLAAAIRGALEWKQILPYWISQAIGAAVAVLLASRFAEIPETAAAPEAITALVVGEFLFTFALCYVVLQVATSKKTEGNSYYGFAIGATVTVGAFAVGGILCPGAFNPAVALGLNLMHAVTCKAACIIAATNLVAGACAAITYKFVNSEE